jgi:autotransporter family porin
MLAITCGMGALASDPVLANSWIGGTSADWFNGSNWTDGVPPTASTDIVIGLSSQSPIFFPVIANAQAAFAQDTSISTSGIGSLNVDGPGSSLTTAELNVGHRAPGQLNITNGGVVESSNYIFIARVSSGGSVTVDGLGSKLIGHQRLKLGDYPSVSGLLRITNGGAVISDSVYVGQSEGASGTATVDGLGSSWSTNLFLLGIEGTGQVNVSNGGALLASDMIIAANSTFNIGAAPNSAPVAPGILNTPTVELNATSSQIFFNHTDTTGTYQFTPLISGLGQVTQSAGNTTLTAQNTYTGGTHLNGGTLQVSSDANLGDGAGTLSFDGGTLGSTNSFSMTRTQALNAGGGTFNTAAGTTLTNSGVITGAGSLNKTGSGTMTLAGANSQVGNVEVAAGTLNLAQSGAFSTTGDYTTQSGATTQLGQTDSTLAVGGVFTQAANTTFAVTLEATHPVITADTAQLNGLFRFDGFLLAPSPPVKASDALVRSFTLIQTTNGITGDFTNSQSAQADLDYLLPEGRISGNNYDLGFRMAWTDGGQAQGTGDFTLKDTTSFDVDLALADQSVPAGGFVSGWDGKTLTKLGEGLLQLSAANTYTGGTVVREGTLALSGVGTLGASTNTTTVEGGTLDLGGTTQAQATLNQSGGTVRGGTLNLGTYQLSGGTLAADSTLNASSLFDLQKGTVNGVLAGPGLLQKTTTDTVTLAGVNSNVGSVDVQQGTLQLEQLGAFTTTGNYTTQAGATTDIGRADSTLAVGGVFTQAANSTLEATLDATRPVIVADTAQLDGLFRFDGFVADPTLPVKASEALARSFTLIQTTNGITGNFSNSQAAQTDLDYLLRDGQVSADGKNYDLGFRMAWTDGGQAQGTGDFGVKDGTAFDVDIVLADQSVPAGGFVSGWDGKSLTKLGEGLLVLSANNTYTGSTTVQAGTLRADVANSFASNSNVIVNGGVLDLNGNDQLAHRLAGSGGQIQLNGATLTADNAGQADGSTFSGSLVDGTVGGGRLIKTGSGTLVLAGSNTYTGGTTISDGTLQLGNGTTTGSMAGNIVNDAVLAINNPTAVTLAGQLSGTGQLAQLGSGTTTLTGVGSSQSSVEVAAGTLNLAQAGTFTTSNSYATLSGATTRIGQAQSTLTVGDVFTQDANSTLAITLDATQPVIRAGSAQLGGVLTLDGVFTQNGFAADPTLPVTASGALQRSYTLIQTLHGITGDFTNSSLDSSGADYLLREGHVSADGNDYELGYRLAWTDGGQAQGTGNFTVNEAPGFNLDIAMADQSVPAGGFVSGWDGKSLTKLGDEQLVLSAVNTYTGSTTVEAGTLRTDVANSFASSSDVIVDGGVLNLNGNAQLAQRLAGTGGQVQLNGATLTANNATTADSTTFAGNLVDGITAGGSLTKTGDGTLTLTGQTGWAGNTRLEGGELVLDGRTGGAQLISNIIGTRGTRLSLQNGASLTGWIDPTDINIGVGSTWRLTADSQVDNVSLAGAIQFAPPPALPLSAGRTLTASNWVGQGGTVELYSVLGNDSSASDKIVIDGGRASGNTGLIIRHAGGDGAQTDQGIRVVQTLNGATTDVGAFTLSSASDGYRAGAGSLVAGAYDYRLVRGGNNGVAEDWYLSSDPSPTEPTPNEVYRPEVGTYMNNKLAASSMQVHTLHERQSQAPGVAVDQKAASESNGWLRIANTHSDRTGAGDQDLSDTISLIHGGADLLRWSDGGDGSIRLGAMGMYGKSDNRADNGSLSAHGSVEGYSVGMYATWYGHADTQTGPYVDSWVMYGTFDNEVKGQGLATESYDSSNTSASLETGYSFPVYADQNTKLYIEPQGQLIQSNYHGDSHTESNGTVVSGQSESGLTTRLGVRLHADLNGDLGMKPFAQVNWWHGPSSQSIAFDGVRAHDQLPENRLEGKLGLQGNLNKAVSVWGSIGFETGEQDYSASSVQLGAKYSW